MYANVSATGRVAHFRMIANKYASINCSRDALYTAARSARRNASTWTSSKIGKIGKIGHFALLFSGLDLVSFFLTDLTG
jgi:hypothetical protein